MVNSRKLDHTLALIRENSPEVREFNLSQFLPSASDAYLFHVAEAISKNTNMEDFKIILSPVDSWTETGMRNLAAAIKVHPKITTIEINVLPSATESTTLIQNLLTQPLTEASKIKTLILFVERPEPNLLDALTTILQQNTSLTVLALAVTPDPDAFTQNEWELFAASLSNKNILSFTLVSARIPNAALTAIANVLSAKNNLENLNLIDCGLTPQNIGAVNKILKANPGLEVLDLSDNALSLPGMGLLARELVKLKKLRALSLNNTLLNGPAYIVLLRVLRALNIKRLDLSNNVLNDFTLSTLTQIIEEIKSVKEIIFKSETLAFHHLQFLAPVLSNHRICKLRAFTIDFNEKEILPIVNHILDSNPHLDGFSHPDVMISSYNKHLMRQRLIDYAILLAFIVGPTELSAMNIRRLPFEIKIMILNLVITEFMGISPRRMTMCWTLLLQNSALHRWSQLTRTEAPLRLFETKTEDTKKREEEGLNKASAEVLSEGLSGLDVAWITKR